MRSSFLVALLVAMPAAFGHEAGDPNSPRFDPVARMQRFYPGWRPPAVSQEELSKFPLGSAQRPVRTQGPQGQHAYLERLVCRNGEAPSFKRLGSMDVSPYGFHMDLYELDCGGRSKETVYMDLYHPRVVEQEPIPGFSLRN